MLNRDLIYRTATELLDLVDKRTTNMGPQTVRTEAAFYLDPELFAREKEVIFRRTPLFMGLSSELPAPGACRTEMAGDVPVLLTRNKAGEVKAFLNACRHRGAKLVREPCQSGKSRLVCPYHSWTYDLDGNLQAVASAPTFGDIDKSEFGLVELPCQEKYGLIYIALSPGVKVDIDEILGDHAQEFSQWGFDQTTFVDETTIPWDVNWKLALDTYCENYHFAAAHKNSLALTRMTNCSVTWRFGYKDRSHVITFPSHNIGELKAIDQEKWTNVDDYFSYIYYLYPGAIVSIFPDKFVFWRIFPGAQVGKSVTRGTSFTRNLAPTEQDLEAARGALQRVGDLIRHEDYPLGQDAQEAYDSGLLPHAIFGRNELEVIGMHEAIRAAVAEAN